MVNINIIDYIVKIYNIKNMTYTQFCSTYSIASSWFDFPISFEHLSQLAHIYRKANNQIYNAQDFKNILSSYYKPDSDNDYYVKIKPRMKYIEDNFTVRGIIENMGITVLHEVP